jgi:ribosomal protein S18 acetylase RimI-like enzyme
MIRPLRRDEGEAAVDVWRAAELTRPWNDPHADFNQAVDGAASAVLGAFVDDHLVGTAMVGHDGHRGWVYYLGVHPDHRGRQLGRALMDASEQWVRERGIPKIQVMVRGENTATRGFYEALGYGLDDVVVYSRRF